MSASDLATRIAAARRAVLAQAGLLHREFGRVKSDWKADGTRVTAADLAISDGIVRELGAQFPGDDICSEERADSAGPVPLTRRFAWVLDPIDGTNNYAMGIPACAISLALLEHGEPVYGVIYDLARRTLLHGGPGHGLCDGDRAAAVRPETPHAQTVVAFHTPYDKRYAPHAMLLVENFKIRALGSSTLHLAYVAAGLLDGAVDHNVKIWDIAAAVALCRAGGATVEYLNGDPFPLRQFDVNMARIQYIAGNPAMCGRLRTLLTAPVSILPAQ